MSDVHPEPGAPRPDADVPRVDFDVHSGEDLGDLDRARSEGDGGDWPAGGAPDTDEEGTATEPNETGPHGEAVHQSDS